MGNNYIKALRQRFHTQAKMADFMGVSLHTVKSWEMGRRNPGSVERQFIDVLATLAIDAPELFERLAHGPSERYERPYIPYLFLLETPEIPQREHKRWSDDYWYPRTVADRDDVPEIITDLKFLNKLTEEQEAEYWEACKFYEQRTGRFFVEL